MANVWAIKSGDWSDTTVWNTGALPTSADDVYANNFNVNVNQNITVNSIRCTGITGVNTGGTFVFNTANVIANISDNFYYGGTGTSFILITATSGNVIINAPTAIITKPTKDNLSFFNYSGNCNLTITTLRLLGNLGNVNYIIYKTSLGLLILNTEIVGGPSSSGAAGVVYLGSLSDSTINGNITGGPQGSPGSIPVWVPAGNLQINGNITGGSAQIAVSFTSSAGELKVTGNVTGGLARAITATNGNVVVIGNITGGSANGITAIDCSGTTSLNHIGTVQASAQASAISCNTPTQSTIISTGPFLKNGYIVAIASQTLRINFNSNSYFQFKKSNGDDIDYVSTVEGYNYPTPADVRYGVEYKSGLAIGTCHIPTPDNVRKNIPVDNTVGTSDNVNAEDILEAIQNSSLPIAERLRNVATVESTGAQLEAYQ